MEKHIKQGDTAGRIKFAVTAGGAAQDLTGCSIRVKFANGTIVPNGDVTIESPATAGIVSISAEEMSDQEAAAYAAEVEVTFADTTVKTYPEDRDRPLLHVHRTL